MIRPLIIFVRTLIIYDKGITMIRALIIMIRDDKGGANHGHMIRVMIRVPKIT